MEKEDLVISYNFEKFHNITTGLQSIAIAIGVVVGGLWTIYTYDALDARNKALTELKGLEKQLNEQAVITVSSVFEQKELPSDNRKYAKVGVTLKNHGSRNTRLDFGDKVIAVSRMKKSEEDWTLKQENIMHFPALTYNDVGQSIIGNLPYIVVRAGGEVVLHFWLQFPQPGLYFMEFQARYSEQESYVFAKLVDSDVNSVYVFTQDFIIVE